MSVVKTAAFQLQDGERPSVRASFPGALCDQDVAVGARQHDATLLAVLRGRADRAVAVAICPQGVFVTAEVRFLRRCA